METVAVTELKIGDTFRLGGEGSAPIKVIDSNQVCVDEDMCTVGHPFPCGRTVRHCLSVVPDHERWVGFIVPHSKSLYICTYATEIRVLQITVALQNGVELLSNNFSQPG